MCQSNNEVIEKIRNITFNEPIKKDKSIDTSYQNQEIIKDYMNFIYNGSDITQKYNVDIIKQCQRALTCFIGLFLLIAIFLCVIIGYELITKKDILSIKTLIPLIIGGFSELFTAIMIKVIKKLLESRDQFFYANYESEHLSKIIGLIQTMPEGDSKNQMIEKIVDNFCEENRS